MEINVCIRAEADIRQINACKKRMNELEDTIGYLSKVFSLAGNEVRMKILFLLLEENELCVCDLSDILNMKIPAVSQHLRKLKDAGIIQNRKQAQTIYYSLKGQARELLMPFFNLISGNIKSNLPANATEGMVEAKNLYNEES